MRIEPARERAFGEAFGLGLRGIEFGAASRRANAAPSRVVARHADATRASGTRMIWARCSTRVRLGRARFTSGRARFTSDRARCRLGRARCSLARCPVERPRRIRVSGSGFGGASAGARGPTRGVASRGGWRTRDGERDDATRRGTGRGRGPGGGSAAAQVRRGRRGRRTRWWIRPVEVRRAAGAHVRGATSRGGREREAGWR